MDSNTKIDEIREAAARLLSFQRHLNHLRAELDELRTSIAEYERLERQQDDALEDLFNRDAEPGLVALGDGASAALDIGDAVVIWRKRDDGRVSTHVCATLWTPDELADLLARRASTEDGPRDV